METKDTPTSEILAAIAQMIESHQTLQKAILYLVRCKRIKDVEDYLKKASFRGLKRNQHNKYDAINYLETELDNLRITMLIYIRKICQATGYEYANTSNPLHALHDLEYYLKQGYEMGELPYLTVDTAFIDPAVFKNSEIPKPKIYHMNSNPITNANQECFAW